MKSYIPITIIGAGAVGSSIALALFNSGVKPKEIYSLKGFSAKKIATKIRINNFGSFDKAQPRKGLVILAVPDSAISGVARVFSRQRMDFGEVIFLHTSGALSSEELIPLKKKGASTGSFHPMQTFPSGKFTTLNNVWIAIEGDAKAVKAGKHLAKILHARTFIISKKAKVLYHTAAVFASNYLVTLLSVVEQIAMRMNIPKGKIWKIYLPLIEQTVHNVINSSPAKALTGPIARGDVSTVIKHLQELSKKKLSHLVPLYSVLGIETARLAKKKKLAGSK